ncbi:hypothetical protein [Alkanindiges illinoisensis]|uniref:hypothetical protein n=1 Tax=Alkanindiges illinoisensis TaxID=197183 RepID=UPI00047D1487|nr:hypothetical protein [Alkanindiges illinoisensis]
MKLRPLYKTTCTGCRRNLHDFSKVCYKCGTYNTVDWKASVQFYALMVGTALGICLLLMFLGKLTGL